MISEAYLPPNRFCRRHRDVIWRESYLVKTARLNFRIIEIYVDSLFAILRHLFYYLLSYAHHTVFNKVSSLK